MPQSVKKTSQEQRRSGARGRSGFTLIEVLLACSILGLIATAVILNFSNLLDGQHLEEGATRVESLVRMTKAQAALQGKRLRLVVDSATGTIAMQWEPNPASDPGKFLPYNRLPIGVDSIAEHVKIISYHRDGPEGAGGSDGPMVIDFEPDGSCDGFTIDLASVSDKDVRQAHVQLFAFDGTIGTQYSSPAEDKEAAEVQ